MLIIDPDPDERWNLIYLVQRHGVRVVATASGELALRYLSGRRVDLVMSPLILPGEPALEIMKKIRRVWPSVKVVLMTHQPSPVLLKLAAKCGALDLVRPPVRGHEVSELLRWLS